MGFNCFKECWRRHSWWLEGVSIREKIRYCFSNCYEDGGTSAPATYRACGYV
jgi:hypothetical protein